MISVQYSFYLPLVCSDQIFRLVSLTQFHLLPLTNENVKKENEGHVILQPLDMIIL